MISIPPLAANAEESSPPPAPAQPKAITLPLPSEPEGPSQSSMAALLEEAASEPLPPVRCPACGQLLPAETVICVNCGYNLRTRQKLSTTIERPPTESESGKRLKSVAGAAGSYALGVTLCLAGILLGMVIWFAIAVFTHHEFVLIAWGVGILAGLGMRLGYRKEDDLAGITAALLCLAAIVGLKWAIFSTIVMPTIERVGKLVEAAANAPPNATRTVLRGEMAAGSPGQAVINVGGPDSDTSLAGAPPGSGDSDAENASQGNLIRGPLPEEVDPDAVEFFSDLAQSRLKSKSALFFVTMIGPWGIVAILAAFFSAYKVGSGTPLR